MRKKCEEYEDDDDDRKKDSGEEFGVEDKATREEVAVEVTIKDESSNENMLEDSETYLEHEVPQEVS